MSVVLQAIFGTVGSAAIIAIVAGFWKGLNSLRDNTRAIQSLEKAIAKIESENSKAVAQQNLRIADLETWRTAVTASLFRVASGGSSGP